jgi:hypothetical protein
MQSALITLFSGPVLYSFLFKKGPYVSKSGSLIGQFGTTSPKSLNIPFDRNYYIVENSRAKG